MVNLSLLSSPSFSTDHFTWDSLWKKKVEKGKSDGLRVGWQGSLGSHHLLHIFEFWDRSRNSTYLNFFLKNIVNWMERVAAFQPKQNFFHWGFWVKAVSLKSSKFFKVSWVMWSISQPKNPKHMVSTLAAWEPAKAVWRQPTTLDEYFWTWYTIYVKLISLESFRKNMLELWTEGLSAQRIALFVCQLITIKSWVLMRTMTGFTTYD